eukprot:Em0240g5a
MHRAITAKTEVVHHRCSVKLFQWAMHSDQECKALPQLKRSFPEKEGPFVKQLDSALQLIGVQRQQYFGGAFVGNHVHKALKLPNVKTLCTAISQMAQEKLPHRSGEVAENTKNFINLFSLFGKCHNISDQNVVKQLQCIDSPAEAKQLMVRLTRGASRQPSSGSQETFWRNLLQHLLTLRGRVFTCVEPSTCYQVFTESLLCSGQEANIQLATASLSEGAVAEEAETRKHKINDPKCLELGWVYTAYPKQQCFIPMDAHLNISKLLYDHLEKVSVTAADQLFSKMAVSKVSLQLAIYYARTAESSNGEPLLCPPVY